jgi:hypothetical protein
MSVGMKGRLEIIEKARIMKSSRVQMVFMFCFAVWGIGLSLGFMWTLGDNDKLRERLDAVNEEAELLVDKVLMMDEELKARDSLLMSEIGKSEDQVMEYMRLRAESWTKAEALADSIKVKQAVRDSLINRDLKW